MPVRLDVELFSSYRVCFEPTGNDWCMRTLAAPVAAKMAKQGLSLLQNEPGISVTMIETEGWKWLSSLCDPYVVHGGVMKQTNMTFEPQMTEAIIAERVQADEYFVRFLEGLKV